ncbi:hypothetical protein PIB30_112064, partial [Stylosanthes scabra]|nr:hypothetical protein [Stylosanthes scabra]
EKRLKRLIKPSNRWNAVWACDDPRMRFQVQMKKRTLDVDLMRRTCSCNVWQLT